MKDIILNIKLIFSPVKIILCIALAVAIPFFMDTMSMHEFYSVFAVYISIIGVIVFSEIPLIDRDHGMDEIIYITKHHTWKSYLIRMLSAMLAISLIIVLSAYIFVLRISYHKILVAYDLQTQLILLKNVIPYVMLVASLSMTISNLFRSVKFGYVITSIYCLLSVVYGKEYISSIINSKVSLIFILIMITLMILINLYLDSIKPINRGVLVRYLKIKEIKQRILLVFKEYNLLTEKEY